MFPNDNRALQLQTRLGAPSIRSSRASLRSRESRNSRLRRMTASQEVNSNFIETLPPFQTNIIEIHFFRRTSKFKKQILLASHDILVFFSVHRLLQSFSGPREDVQDRAGRGCSRWKVQLHHETVQRKICTQPQLNFRYMHTCMRKRFKMKER